MARPLRLQVPATPAGAVPRERLLALLRQRWSRRLVTLRAGPGLGKTTLLAAALSDLSRPVDGRDAWLGCEAADESAVHLLAGLAAAVDVPPGAPLGDLLDLIWAQAPAHVCLVLDDVHEVPPGSDGAALLGRLVTELPTNGHVVVASRTPAPFPVARLAAARALVRVEEGDLLFDPAELAAFAAARSVDPDILSSTGGWPALAELTASAGSDLVPDYLWEEVLVRIGEERADLLARLTVVGGGDDEVATALAGSATRIDEVVAGVPLVLRTEAGWAVPHSLWGPALARRLPAAEVERARRQAADVHRSRGRHGTAADLLAAAQDWEGVTDVLREVIALDLLTVEGSSDLGRVWRLLPPRWRDGPEAQLVAGHELQATAPLDAIERFEGAASAFRSRGDVDGEVAAIAADGLVRWWANDLPGLLALYARLEELTASGSEQAAALLAVGGAAMAHLGGDSEGVLRLLAGVDDAVSLQWRPTLRWLRSVAHRRAGELGRAHEELDLVADDPSARAGVQLRLARLRTDWLLGRVDHVRAHLPEVVAHYEQSGDRFLAKEAILELACKTAWLGEVETTRDLLTTAERVLPEAIGPLQVILRAIATGALAVEVGDEERAAAVLAREAMSTLGRPESWYWRDRAAIALVHVLVPASRPLWQSEHLGPAHLPGLRLGEALTSARGGDLSLVVALSWPEPALVRAHLPARWAAELAALGTAAGNPPPTELILALGPRARSALRGVVLSSPRRSVVAAARRALADLPVEPGSPLRIGVLGPLELDRGGERAAPAELRRQRVRELLVHLVVHRRARREAVAAELWPELDDGGRNLRVTLSYLQRALQPDRDDGTPPYFVRSEGSWLVLGGGDRLTVDAWELDAGLDRADAAEREGAPAAALAAYQSVLHLWRGEPLEDVPYAPWAEVERTRLRARYSAAAIRAGELLLAAGDVPGARVAAGHAVTAEPASEPAHRLLVRSHLAVDDAAGARRALEACRAALAALDLRPGRATLELMEGGAPGR